MGLKIMGIDPGLHCTGICCVSDTGVECMSIDSRKLFGFRRAAVLGYIYTTLQGFITLHLPDIAVIEGYSYQSPFQACTVGEVGGVIRLALYSSLVSMVVIPPAMWKRIVYGDWKRFKKKNSKDKENIIEFIRDTFSVEVGSVDEADAVCISYALREILRDRTNKRYKNVVREIPDFIFTKAALNG